MSEPIEVEAKVVHYHNCRALGPNTKIIEATRLDSKNEYVIGYQYKCPFCSQTAGPFRPAPGIMENPNGEGWLVDTKIAIRVK